MRHLTAGGIAKENMEMRNTQKNQSSYLKLKHRVTAAVMASFMLAQICLPTIAAAAYLTSDETIEQALSNHFFERASYGNSYLYQKSEFAFASNLNHQNISSFHKRLVDSKVSLPEPTYIPIAGDITIIIPHQPTGKVVGDSYVQNRLIRQQIYNQIGRHFIDPDKYASQESQVAEINQMNDLYNNAYVFAQNTGHIYGEKLSSNDTTFLDTQGMDIIWPERRLINGETVIVPVLYLSAATISSQSIDGHEIEFLGGKNNFGSVTINNQELRVGRNSFLHVVNNLSLNNASIKSEGNIGIKADGHLSVLGSVIDAESSINLNVGGIFSILGGSQVNAGNNINIHADKDVHLKTFVHLFTDRYGKGTRLSEISSINAHGDISIKSGQNIQLEASTITSSNGSITLEAGENINILPVITQYSSEYNVGDWEASRNTLNAIGSTISAKDTIKLIADGAINITASELISTQGGIELLADQGIHVLDYLDQEQIQRVDRKGKTKGQSSEFRTHAVRAILSAGKAVLLDSEYGDVTLKAAEITSTAGTQVHARNGSVHLLMTKELEEFHLQTVRKGTWTIKTRTEDIVHENNIQNAIVGGLQVQAMHGINVEYTGKEGATLQEQIEEYRNIPELKWMADLYDDALAAGGPQVNWEMLEEVHKELKKTKRNLSPAAMAIIAIVVCVAMGPVGAQIVGSGGGGLTAAISSSVSSTTLGAALSAGTVTLTTQAVQSLAAGNSPSDTLEAMSSSDSLKSLAVSMVTAGAMKNTDFDLFKVAEGAQTSVILAKQAGQALVNATVRAGISVTINGGNSDAYKDAFIQNLATHAINTIGDAMASKIGSLASGTTPEINEAIKYIALAGSGCIVGLASASNSSGSSNSTHCYSAAGGAVVGEYVGQLYSEQKLNEQRALIENYLHEKGIANTTDLSGYDAISYGELVAQRPMLSHEEIAVMRGAGVDLSKLSAALMAFVAGGDVNIAADSAERAARYSAFYNFDAAIDAALAIDQFLQLEKVSLLLTELQSAQGDKTKIELIIQRFIDTGEFEFLRGLSTLEALDALIHYVRINGDTLALVEGLKAVSYSLLEGTVSLTYNSIEQNRQDLVAAYKSALHRTLNTALTDPLDPRIYQVSETLFDMMLVNGFDPHSDQFVSQLNALIDLAPPETRRDVKFSVGMAFGVTQFLAETGADVAGLTEFVAYAPIAALDHVLFSVTGDPEFEQGSNLFNAGLFQLQHVISNVDSIPENAYNDYKASLAAAEDAAAAGNDILAGKIYTSSGLKLITAAIGITAVIRAVRNVALLKTPSNSFEDLAEELNAVTDRGFGRYLNNDTNPEIRDAFISHADDVRLSQLADFDGKGNLALANVDIPGLPTQMKAFSQFQKGENGFVALPDGPTILQPLLVNRYGIVDGKDSFSRIYDGEFKILETTARSLGNNTSIAGRIDLFTELQACTSCGGAIVQFRTMYPNIQLNVFTKK